MSVLAARPADTEALVLIRECTEIRTPLLRELPRLKLISQRSVYPHIDIGTCSELGIVVSSNLHQGSASYATAELTWGLVIAGMRQIPQQVTSMKAGRWQAGVGHSLRNKALGIYGYGRIGKVIADYGKAFGMNVLVWAGPESRGLAQADEVGVAGSRQSFFEQCDVVSLHMRLVDATRGIVTRSDLDRMKASALFVNTSRAASSSQGHWSGRSPQAGPAWRRSTSTRPSRSQTQRTRSSRWTNVICTPHIGYVSTGGNSSFPMSSARSTPSRRASRPTS